MTKILHLASFQGNLGDILSHSGFRPWFELIVGKPVEWVDIEIRDYYRQEAPLIDLVQRHLEDAALLVIGGGNYWETWPTRSRTGTSLDLTFDELTSLNLPIFFNSIGVDVAQGVSAQARALPEFLNACSTVDEFFLTVRNDGARETLVGSLGHSGTIDVLPDHGFFGTALSKTPNSGSIAAINLAGDMENVRFSDVSQQLQFSQIASFFNSSQASLFDQVVFIPHVLGDLDALRVFTKNLDDKFRRERLGVAKLDTSTRHGNQSLQEYSRSSFTVSNRFHSNVVALSMGTRFVPLINYPQIELLLNNLPVTWPFPKLEVATSSDWPSLLEMALQVPPESYFEYSIEVMDGLRAQRQDVADRLSDWLRNLGII